MKAKGRAATGFYIAAVLVLVAYAFMWQGQRGIWESSEGRYTIVAVEMLRSHDWLHPRIHPEHPHWTKPPLTYWAIAASMKWLGATELAVRLPGILAFIFTTLLVWALGRIFVPARPWLPALVYGTFMFPATASNAVTTDNLLTFWTTLAMAGFAFAYWARAPGLAARNGAVIGWAAFGAGFLVKGPAVALPFIALMLFHWFRGRGIPGMALRWWPGLLVSGVIAASWYIALARERPDLIVNFLWNEVILRATTDRHHRNSDWYDALIVYGPVLVLGTLPWTVAVWRGVTRPLAAWWRDRRGRGAAIDHRDAFLLLWLLVPLTVFVLAKSRLPLYLLPSFAPLALLAARHLAGQGEGHRLWFKLAAAGALTVIAVRVVAGLVAVPQDNRALAARLGELADRPVAEVVFVDADPYLGLGFYMDTEVEGVRSAARGKPQSDEQDLASELEEDEGERLWLVREYSREDFEAAASASEGGARRQYLGEVRADRTYHVYLTP